MRSVVSHVALHDSLPVMLEEIAGIHAEGYAAGEMNHGPIALIERGIPMVALAPVGATYEKTTHDIEAVKARNAIVIAVATRGDEAIRALADYTIFVPPASAWMQPFLVTLALQLFAYHMACIRGRDWPVADTPFERNRSVFPLEPAEDREVIHRE